MRVGDLVLSPWGETAILLSEPRLSDDWEPGCHNSPWYVADVYSTKGGGFKDNWVTDDLEIISENR